MAVGVDAISIEDQTTGRSDMVAIVVREIGRMAVVACFLSLCSFNLGSGCTKISSERENMRHFCGIRKKDTQTSVPPWFWRVDPSCSSILCRKISP